MEINVNCSDFITFVNNCEDSLSQSWKNSEMFIHRAVTIFVYSNIFIKTDIFDATIFFTTNNFFTKKYFNFKINIDLFVILGICLTWTQIGTFTDESCNHHLISIWIILFGLNTWICQYFSRNLTLCWQWPTWTSRAFSMSNARSRCLKRNAGTGDVFAFSRKSQL